MKQKEKSQDLVKMLTCPQCGELARGTVETVSGCALIDIHEDGTANYSGETKIWWDEQKTERNEDGHAQFICPNAHQWFADIDLS